MADIKKYGDLDDKELLEFLAEIKSGDEDIEEAEINEKTPEVLYLIKVLYTSGVYIIFSKCKINYPLLYVLFF